MSADLTQSLFHVISCPLQLTLCLASPYQLIGPAMFAGLGGVALMIPVNWVIAKFMKTLQKQQMRNRDARTRLMTEILSHIKPIKLYAWEETFMQRLKYARNTLELVTLKKIGTPVTRKLFLYLLTPLELQGWPKLWRSLCGRRLRYSYLA